MVHVATAITPKLSFAEFERIAELHEGKIELLDGVIVYPDMSKATDYHTYIFQNLLELYRRAWLNTGYNVYAETMGLRIDDYGETTEFIPDLMVGPKFHSIDRHSHIKNPICIIEVLSPSTEHYDRTQKLPRYQQIESVQEIVLVQQDVPLVDVYRRFEGTRWELITYQQPTDAVTILGVSAQLIALYDQTGLFAAQGAG
jgi:Uma2 family endonuclease